MPAPLGAYLITFGAALFSAAWALTFYRTISHIDPPDVETPAKTTIKAA